MINSQETINISRQLELLEINRSSYYYKPKPLSAYDIEIMSKIDVIYTEHPYYGTLRMSEYLKSKGYCIGRKALRRYYQIMDIEAIYPKQNLSKRNHAHKVYPYLLKDLDITRKNHVWSSDITYIKLSKGFVYLVAVIDCYSRYILSWNLSITLESEFCVLALEEAITKYGKPDIFNTDQGAQFTSNNFTSVLKNNCIKISMDGKGRALDNVFIERFWRSLKQEKIYLIILNTVKEARDVIRNYIDFYNTKRMHQSLEYATPKSVYFKTENLVH